MSWTNYAENIIASYMLTTATGTAITRPTAWYAALHTADPTDAGTGAEVSGGSYARQPVTFPSPTNGVTSPGSDILFPTATANWGTVTHVAIWDSLTGGNLLKSGALTASQAVNTGNTFKLPAGQVTSSED